MKPLKNKKLIKILSACFSLLLILSASLYLLNRPQQQKPQAQPKPQTGIVKPALDSKIKLSEEFPHAEKLYRIALMHKKAPGNRNLNNKKNS